MSIYKESEARDKWCPMVRVNNEGVPVNDGAFCRPDGVLVVANNCIGSKCAMWRFYEPLRRRVINARNGCETKEPDRPSSVPADWEFYACDDDPACWVEPEQTASANRRGFCGIAGKPEIAS